MAIYLWMLSHLSCVWLFATPWTIARQAPLPVGTLQARILEWVAKPSSRGFSWPRNQIPHHLGLLHLPTGSLPLAPPYNVTFTILTVFKGTVLWHWAYSHCCVTITTVHLQNYFVFFSWNSVATKQKLPVFPPSRAQQPSLPAILN